MIESIRLHNMIKIGQFIESVIRSNTSIGEANKRKSYVTEPLFPNYQ